MKSCNSLLLLLLVAGCMASPQPPATYGGFPVPPTAPTQSSTYRPYTLSSGDVEVVKQSVAKSLKDPYSPVFGVIVGSISNDGVVSACGTVNGKNSYGAYIGQTPFIGVLVANRQAFPVVAIGGTADENLAVSTLCQRQSMAVD